MKSLTTHQLADLCVLLTLGAMAGWYLWSSYSASAHIFNLILVLPLTLIILALCSVTFVRELLSPTPADPELESVASVAPVILLFCGYVLSLNWLGFDVGTFLFVLAFLIVHGESRWRWAVAYSLVFAAGVALFFSSLLPYPMPMLLLPAGF